MTRSTNWATAPRWAANTFATSCSRYLNSGSVDLFHDELELPLHLGAADDLVDELPLQDVHLRVQVPEFDHPDSTELVHAGVGDLRLAMFNLKLT